jgi:hypothetical protein
MTQNNIFKRARIFTASSIGDEEEEEVKDMLPVKNGWQSLKNDRRKSSGFDPLNDPIKFREFIRKEIGDI